MSEEEQVTICEIGRNASKDPNVTLQYVHNHVMSPLKIVSPITSYDELGPDKSKFEKSAKLQ